MEKVERVSVILMFRPKTFCENAVSFYRQFFFCIEKVDVKTNPKAFVTCLIIGKCIGNGYGQKLLPDADLKKKTFWHLGCQDAALFPHLLLPLFGKRPNFSRIFPYDGFPYRCCAKSGNMSPTEEYSFFFIDNFAESEGFPRPSPRRVTVFTDRHPP